MGKFSAESYSTRTALAPKIPDARFPNAERGWSQTAAAWKVNRGLKISAARGPALRGKWRRLALRRRGSTFGQKGIRDPL